MDPGSEKKRPRILYYFLKFAFSRSGSESKTLLQNMYPCSQVTETEMLAIVFSFLQLNYIDDKLINTMEKLIKHKGCQVYNIHTGTLSLN